MQILFFSRGRGRGHAVPDAAIGSELSSLTANVQVTYVSYGTGYRTLEEMGFDAEDMNLQDDATFVEVMVKGGQVIRRILPDIIISHEEFCIPPLAKMFGIPNLYLGDWLLSSEHFFMRCLQSSDCILFLEERGLFPEPPELRSRIQYLGPMVRRLAYERTPEERGRARRELEIAEHEKVVSVIPGTWATEARLPLFKLITDAFTRIEVSAKTLIWVAGSDFDELYVRNAVKEGKIVRSHNPIEQLIIASDLVITKGNRGATLDAAAYGIPSLSLCSGSNPIDETIISQIKSNKLLREDGVDPEYLAGQIEKLLLRPVEVGVPQRLAPSVGARFVASQVLDCVRQFLEAGSGS